MTLFTLEDLPRPLGHVLHIGAGTGTGTEVYRAAGAEGITLVEPDPDQLAILRESAGGWPEVVIVAAAVAGGTVNSAAPLRRFGFADLNSLRAPAGLKEIFPGLEELPAETVEVRDPVSLLDTIKLSPHRCNLLVIEAPGEAMTILEALDKAGRLVGFDRILVQEGATPLYAGATPINNISDWFAARDRAVRQSNGIDPARPVLRADRDPRAEEFTRQLQAKSKALDDTARARNAATARAEDLERQLAARTAELEAALRTAQNDAAERRRLEFRLARSRAEIFQIDTQLDLMRTLLLSGAAGALQEDEAIFATEANGLALTAAGDTTWADASSLSVRPRDRIRTLWRDGAWEALADLEDEIDTAKLQERAEMALLVAAGHLQEGYTARGAELVRRAVEWGCSPALMTRVLIGGAQNGLGRVASLLGDQDRAAALFAAATGGAPFAGPARDVREKARLGLLHEAAKLVDAEREHVGARVAPDDPRLEMISVQIDLLNNALTRALQHNQLPPDGTDGSGNRAATTTDPVARSVSQLGQDLWVLEQTGYKRQGYFVEFGATDGVLLSNTWLLETDYAWEGLCAEPNPAFFKKLRRNRRCTVAPDCITGRSGERVEFVLAQEYGGVVAFADRDSHNDKREAFRRSGKVIEVETVSLHDFLLRHGAPRQIDYVSIDTEGTEYDILQAFPFDAWDIGLFTIEHNYTADRARIRDLMTAQGYHCTEMKFDDWYFRPATASDD